MSLRQGCLVGLNSRQALCPEDEPWMIENFEKGVLADGKMGPGWETTQRLVISLTRDTPLYFGWWDSNGNWATEPS